MMHDDPRDGDKKAIVTQHEDLMPQSEPEKPLAELSVYGTIQTPMKPANAPAQLESEPADSRAEPLVDPLIEASVEEQQVRPLEKASDEVREILSPPTRIPLSAAIKAGRFGWAAFLASCTVAGLVTFWPRMSISMVSDPEQTSWLYVVNNDGYFPAKNVVGNCAITSITAGWQGGTGTINHVEAFFPQHLRQIRPQDAHTFRCPSFVFDNPGPDINGAVKIDVAYRYARFIRRTEHACYQLEPRDAEGRMWVRQACP